VVGGLRIGTPPGLPHLAAFVHLFNAEGGDEDEEIFGTNYPLDQPHDIEVFSPDLADPDLKGLAQIPLAPCMQSLRFQQVV
jgi:hypothetical protein